MANPLCEKLGIERPLILAPMAGAVGPAMLATISNLGGLGTIPLWRASGDQIRLAVGQIVALTDRPYAVNLNIEFLKDEQIDACLECEVPAISLFWGHSGAAIGRVKSGGAICIATVGTAAEARRAVDAGADIIVAQGWEAGGHVWGSVSTLALVPAVVDAVPGTPVVAAGGIADGRGVAAAFALGASGVWVGTRFLAAEELDIHPAYRQAVLDANEDATAHADDLYDVGWPDAPHRALRNATFDAWVAAGHPAPGSRPREGTVLGQNAKGDDVVIYQSHTPGPADTGDIGSMSLWAGQGAAQVRAVMPAAEIMDDLLDGAREVIASLK